MHKTRARARFSSVGHGQPNGYMPGGHVFGTLSTNFREPPKGEVPRITLPRTPVNKDHASAYSSGQVGKAASDYFVTMACNKNHSFAVCVVFWG